MSDTPEMRNGEKWAHSDGDWKRAETLRIEPALNAEEWAECVSISRGGADPLTYAILADPDKAIAWINGNRSDSDPRKITRETVIGLTSAAHFLENGRMAVEWPADGNPWKKLAADLRSTADALASYLPPEGT